jgi:imidazolonepropionase-like amidohydrolase
LDLTFLAGYGLEAETELKMLKVLHKVQSKVPMDIVSNYLGGHSVPKGKSAAEATEDIVNVQIPLVKVSMHVLYYLHCLLLRFSLNK